MNKHDELPEELEDTLISYLHKIIKLAIRVLAILMTLLIISGVVDVVYVYYQNLMEPPIFLLEISDIFHTFASFLVVLIGIEIFQNIVVYLRTDVIPMQLVLATALMAVARKIIVIDFKVLSPTYIFALGFVVLALGVTYFLVNKTGE